MQADRFHRLASGNLCAIFVACIGYRPPASISTASVAKMPHRGVHWSCQYKIILLLLGLLGQGRLSSAIFIERPARQTELPPLRPPQEAVDAAFYASIRPGII